MNHIVKDFLDYITGSESPKHDKETVQAQAVERFNLIQDRKIFYCSHFAVRFSYTKDSKGFSNTILSLSALQKYVRIPLFVVRVVGDADNLVYLANTTFIKKISHSSQQLTMTNIKGSFNGSDIYKSYDGIDNIPDNVETLFAYHSGMSWHDNLERLVAETGKIVGTGVKFSPTHEQIENINKSVDRAIHFLESSDFATLREDLEGRVHVQEEAIFAASRIDNVNIRGRLIEYLITKAFDKDLITDLKRIEENEPSLLTHNDLGDYHREFFHEDDTNSVDSYTDIKTKVIYLGSNPKAYNIDKFLECMANSNTVFLFFFVGIDENGIASTKLCPVYDKELIDATICQFHWAGRNSRGVTQLKGESINVILGEDYTVSIDKKKAEIFISDLLNK